jgi:hypothetical protein
LFRFCALFLSEEPSYFFGRVHAFGSSETRGAKKISQVRLDMNEQRNEFENQLPEIQSQQNRESRKAL